MFVDSETANVNKLLLDIELNSINLKIESVSIITFI